MTSSLDGRGPFAAVDADTGLPIMSNRCNKAAAAFARGDRYIAAHPGADFKVIDGQGVAVPRPHAPLPTAVDGRGLKPVDRRRNFLVDAYHRRWLVRQSRTLDLSLPALPAA